MRCLILTQPLHRYAVLAMLLLCLTPGSAQSQKPNAATTPAALLAHAEQLRTGGHSQFQLILDQLHQNESQLTPAQRLHLRYLDAWQAAYAGNYAKSTRMLNQIIDHPHDSSLSIRAKALLIHNKFVGKQYEEAYTLANTLMTDLPKVTDVTARIDVLGQVIQMLDRQDQYDLALKYARQMKASFRSGKGQCLANLYETQTILYAGGKLTSDSPAFRKTINSCLAVNQDVYANAMRLDWSGLMIDEGHANRAIAFLHRITPDILKPGYQFHIAELHVLSARAYLSVGNNTRARKSAQTALASSDAKSFNWVLQNAYKVLYEVEKKTGHNAAALTYHEKYFAQDKAAINDAKTRALAYQMVEQDLLAKKLKLEKLSKQNKVLQLRQSLDRKAAENSRLYIALLLIVLAFIAFWLYLTKHSQLRFRKMARHDDLTGALNRPYFLEKAQRALHRLRKARVHVCVLILDLDHFKRVNDTHGHIKGDKVLEHVTTICHRELRDSDIFGRLGGEEFGIVMACSTQHGVEIGNRICRALATSPSTLDEHVDITVTASIGLACSDACGYELRTLLIRADAALYEAKRSGRNQLCEDGQACVGASA